MPRPGRSEVSTLLQEARAVELLMNEAEIPPENLQDYWALSMDLIALVTDIETLEGERPQAPGDDPELFALKHRLRSVISQLAEISAERD